jgi:hypothetical protein
MRQLPAGERSRHNPASAGTMPKSRSSDAGPLEKWMPPTAIKAAPPAQIIVESFAHPTANF